MRVLINHPEKYFTPYGKEIPATNYLPTLDYFLKKAGHEGASTSRALTKEQLLALCDRADCQAVLINNPLTLANLVPPIPGKPHPSISSWRGSRIDLDATRRAIIIGPLDQIHSVDEAPFLMDLDIGKLKKVHVPAQKFEFELLDDPKKFCKWLSWASQSWIMACDIETDQHGVKKTTSSSKRVPAFDRTTMDIDGLGETWITCVSFSIAMANGSIRTAVLPLVNAGGEDFWSSDADYAAALEFLQGMMATGTVKVFHNGLYDAFHLIRYRAWPNNWTLDSMGLSHSQYSELDKDLGFLASRCLYDAYYWKDLADSSKKARDMQTYWYYNGKDAWATLRCTLYLLSNGEDYVFSNYKKKFREVYPSLYGAFEGWRMDLQVRDRLRDKAQASLDELKAQLRIIADDPEFNPNSADQKAELLYEVIGAQKPTRGKSKSKTDKKSRAYVAAQHPILTRVVELLNQFALDSKAVSTYFNFLVWHSRLLFSLDPFGTETGRDASRASAAWVGTQIQNQPPYAKEMYCPDDGYIGFEIDYSKSEAVCTAHLAQCEALIQALCHPELDKNGEPKDFYKHLGTLFFGMEYETVTKEFRNKVLKKINHGTNYMMGALTFIDNLDDINVLYFAAELLGIVITANPSKKAANEMTMMAFATKLLESYHGPFPEVRQWWDKLEKEVKETGRLVSPTGHVRVFFGDPTKSHSVKRSAVAHQPQGLSVEILNRGFWKAYKYSQELGEAILRIKTQIHDSINGQVRIEYAREVIPYLAELVKGREVIHGREMTINVDVEVYHTNWKEKVPWDVFLTTTLPMLEKQRQQTLATAG